MKKPASLEAGFFAWSGSPPGAASGPCASATEDIVVVDLDEIGLPEVENLAGDGGPDRQRGGGAGGGGVQHVDGSVGRDDHEVIGQAAVGSQGLGPHPGVAPHEVG